MMKKGIFLLLCALAFSSAQAAPKKYLIKLKAGTTENKALESNLKDLGNVSELKTSFGEFRVVTTTKALPKNLLDDQIEYIEEDKTWKVFPTYEEKNQKGQEKNDLSDLIDDPMAKNQWALFNDGKNSGWFSSGKAGEDMNALNAWKITKGSGSVRIAVIDTGVDYNHEDLKANVFVNQAELNGQEGVDDDGNGFIDDIHGYDFGDNDADPMDEHGHGTHCSGIIGAAHNTTGIAGMMADVEILPIKFISSKGSGTTEGAILSIDYAIKMGVQVISASWGGDENSKALEDAIVAAGQAGIVFVAAAGNEYNDNDEKQVYPAGYNLPNLISVCSYKSSGIKSSFSNYGKNSVHVCAPGEGIHSTYLSNTYKKLSGTSMACPYVSGAVGLLLSINALTPEQVKEQLIQTSVQTDDLMNYSQSNGRVDGQRLLENTRSSN